MTMACNYDLLNVHMEAIKLSQSWPCKRPDEDKEDQTTTHTSYIFRGGGYIMNCKNEIERKYEILIYNAKYRTIIYRLNSPGPLTDP